MLSINIAVSHRIDINAYFVKNSIFSPVRCGAVYDIENKSHLLGDDTGDNISNKRNSYCELTVQYWMWKNVEADYYGLCHYRRFLSFASKRYKANERNQIVEEYLDDDTCKKYNLNNEEYIESEISKYDLICSELFQVDKVRTPKGYKDTVIEHWKAHDNVLIMSKDLDILLELLQKEYPEYYTDAIEYMNGNVFLGYNCYVMKKELFFNMCEFQFSVLDKMEKMIDTSLYEGNIARTIGYLGEILYSIYVYHIQKMGKYKIANKQLVHFNDTTTAWTNEVISLSVKNDCPIIVFNMDSLNPEAWKETFYSLTRATKEKKLLYIVYYRFISDELKDEIEKKCLKEKDITILWQDINKIDLGRDIQYIRHLELRIYLPWLLKYVNQVLLINEPCVFDKHFASYNDSIVCSYDCEDAVQSIDLYEIRNKYELDYLYKSINNHSTRLEEVIPVEVVGSCIMTYHKVNYSKCSKGFLRLPFIKQLDLRFPKGSKFRNTLVDFVSRWKLLYGVLKGTLSS